MAWEGMIIKSTGGFYYVRREDGSDIECRPRGIFRKQGVKPCVGDRVEISVNDDGSGTVEEIGERKNALIRPPLANLDQMVLVLSVTDPAPNLYITDKFLAVLEHKGIEPVIAITKTDLGNPDEIRGIYSGAGFLVFVVDMATGQGLLDLTDRLAGRFSAFSGNTGVGKSTLLNAMHPQLGLETGETSQKLGRGRHTTRHVEAHQLPNGGLVADTPGFTTVELITMSDMTKTDLPDCFREFEPYRGKCKFQDCTHTCETGCAVLEAANQGKVAASRMEHYRQLYAEIKDVKEWERKGV